MIEAEDSLGTIGPNGLAVDDLGFVYTTQIFHKSPHGLEIHCHKVVLGTAPDSFPRFVAPFFISVGVMRGKERGELKRHCEIHLDVSSLKEAFMVLPGFLEELRPKAEKILMQELNKPQVALPGDSPSASRKIVIDDQKFIFRVSS